MTCRNAGAPPPCGECKKQRRHPVGYGSFRREDLGCLRNTHEVDAAMPHLLRFSFRASPSPVCVQQPCMLLPFRACETQTKVPVKGYAELRNVLESMLAYSQFPRLLVEINRDWIWEHHSSLDHSLPFYTKLLI
jgi:hypothetical protein